MRKVRIENVLNWDNFAVERDALCAEVFFRYQTSKKNKYNVTNFVAILITIISIHSLYIRTVLLEHGRKNSFKSNNNLANLS